MIKPNELRIRNYVFYDNILNTQIAAIHTDYVIITDWINGGIKTSYHLISPIDITPEWLERLGSTYNMDHSAYIFSHFRVGYETGGNWSIVFTDYVICKIKYIHQLQNLHFAMTGKELLLL